MSRTRNRAASALGGVLAATITGLAGLLASSILVLGIVSVWRLIVGV